MASNPQLPNHLIRELMHTIRLKRNDNGVINGDAMVLLALSGKGIFPIFRYVVENYVFASTSQSGVSLQSVLPNEAFNHIMPCRRNLMFLTKGPDRKNHMPYFAAECESFMQGRSDAIKFQTDGSERLVIRFVRELRAYCIPSNPLLFENITQLTIVKFDKSFTPILHSWSDLELLKLDFISYHFNEFFNEVNNGKILLTNLQRLEIRLTFEDLLKILSLTSSFPLPEDVTFKLDLDVMPILGPIQTFPNVKHLKINVGINIRMTTAVLQRFSTIISCFTGLETAKLELYYTHSAYQNEFAEVVEFHEWLCNTNFSFSFEVDYHELARLYYHEKPKSIYGELKSIGYEDYGEPGNDFFTLKKEYGNVKFAHQVKYLDKYRYHHSET